MSEKPCKGMYVRLTFLKSSNSFEMENVLNLLSLRESQFSFPFPPFSFILPSRVSLANHFLERNCEKDMNGIPHSV